MPGYYNGYKLLETDRKLLLEMFPPRYPNVKCDHITVALSEDPLQAPFPYPIAVVGYIDAGNLDVLLCEVDGCALRPNGGFFHITHSTDHGVRSHESNTAIPRAIENLQKAFIGIGGDPFSYERMS